jgi:CheY-like chemotaxis protein
MPRALLVEDESIIAMLVEDMLDDLGYEVVGPAGEVGRAVELAEREALDVAVLDIDLNGEAAWPVADALAARGVPFVIMTGYDDIELRPPHANRPKLHKPFRFREFAAALAEARQDGGRSSS